MYETNSARGVVRAAACALAVAAAPTGLGLAAALAACLVMFYPVD